MTVLYNLGWTYEDDKWYHKDSCRVVEIKHDTRLGDIIEVYQRSGRDYYRGWLTVEEFHQFWLLVYQG